VFATASRGGSSIVSYDIRHRRRRTLRSSGTTQFMNPSLYGSQFLYVSVSRCRQKLSVARRSGRGEKVLMSLAPLARRDEGHENGHTSQGSESGHCPGGERPASDTLLWTTALTRRFAYVTRLRLHADGTVTPVLLRLTR
jgi:hypothetical protein